MREDRIREITQKERTAIVKNYELSRVIYNSRDHVVAIKHALLVAYAKDKTLWFDADIKGRCNEGRLISPIAYEMAQRMNQFLAGFKFPEKAFRGVF
jgi:hypothetical protein